MGGIYGEGLGFWDGDDSVPGYRYREKVASLEQEIVKLKRRLKWWQAKVRSLETRRKKAR